MRILVTGANGYIGAKVVKALCDMGHDVVATDFRNENVDVRASYVKADLFSPKDDWYSFFGNPDVCLHLAWRDGFVQNSDRHMMDLSSHYAFLSNLVSYGLPQLAVMGSMHEVGYCEGAIDEDTPCNPVTQYGIAKNALRQSMSSYCKAHGCRFEWLRGFYIYGGDEFGNSIFCKIRKAAKEGKTTFPFTTGENKFDFIKDTELARLISLSITQSEVLGVINVCSGRPVSLKEQVEEYIKSNSLNIRLEYGTFKERPDESPCIYGDDSKIRLIESIYKKENNG